MAESAGASMQPYDPNKTCGDYGGVTHTGKLCTRPTGWGNDDPTDPCCHAHGRVAMLELGTKKAQALQLIGEANKIREVADKLGVHVRTIYEWREADPEFREEFNRLQKGRDRGRAAEVEDHVFDRILGDKASPAEIIFFLKNRDPDRWRDVWEPKDNGKGGTPKSLAPVDTAKARLTAASVAAAIAPRAASGTVPAAQVDGGSGGDEDGEEEV
jgi:hypothetical protein